MGCPTRDDEHGKTKKDPIKLKISAFMDKVNQRDRDRKVDEGNEAVRDDVQPNDDRIPLVAHSMRHESIGGKESRHEIHHNNKSVVTCLLRSIASGHIRGPIRPEGVWVRSQVKVHSSRFSVIILINIDLFIRKSIGEFNQAQILLLEKPNIGAGSID